MSYEEQEYLNSCTAERRERACRRDWMIRMGIQYGGWILTGLMLAANLVAVVH